MYKTVERFFFIPPAMETNPQWLHVIKLGSVHILWMFVWSKESIPHRGVTTFTQELDKVNGQPTTTKTREPSRVYHLTPAIYDGIGAVMADEPGSFVFISTQVILPGSSPQLRASSRAVLNRPISNPSLAVPPHQARLGTHLPKVASAIGFSEEWLHWIEQ